MTDYHGVAVGFDERRLTERRRPVVQGSMLALYFDHPTTCWCDLSVAIKHALDRRERES